ncbi:MAG: DUF4870 domain-containing protein [Armatimonadetes bacterium]|nr:DUF4870 domain-containing protein [Armatimonadota bacterium]
MTDEPQSPYPYDEPEKSPVPVEEAGNGNSSEESRSEEPTETPAAPHDPHGLGRTSVGMAAHTAAAVACVPPLIPCLAIYMLEKKNKFVRFYAMQSILLGAVWMTAFALLSLILQGMASPLHWLLNVAWIVLSIILAVNAASGKWFRLPVLGDIAAKLAGVDLDQ